MTEEEPKIFDEEAVTERLDGNKQLFAEVLTLFFADYPTNITELREAASRGDGKGIEESAHAVKSALGNLGAMRAHEVAFEIEMAGKCEKLDGIHERITSLEEEILSFQTLARAYLFSA